METLIEELRKLKAETECEIVKVFYESDDVYTIKFIRGNEVVRKVKKGRQQFKDPLQHKLVYYDEKKGIYVHRTFHSELGAETFVRKHKIYQYNLDGEFRVNTGYDLWKKTLKAN